MAGGVLGAAPITLEPVEATTGAESRFAEAVDGIDTPENGWLVPRKGEHEGIFRCVPAVEAGRVRFVLAFHGAEKSSYFSEFSVSATTDPNPSPRSQWDRIFLTAWATDQGWLNGAYPHVRPGGTNANPSVRLDGLVSQDRITGIRVETWASESPKPGDALLTELRMEWLPMGTTNVALGCPVTASHELTPTQFAGFLTDGLIGSYARPEGLHRPDFYFEVDLRHVRALDHITLRGRSEASAADRFTKLHMEFFDQNPATGIPPVWIWHERPTAHVQEPGAVKVVRGSDGEGTFHGRWLRISTANTLPISPQIAEVEAYESIVPAGAEVMANHRTLPGAARVRIPANSNWLSFALANPPLPGGLVLGRRWRIVGMGDNWLPADSDALIESRALPPGEYLFEAQLRHSDSEWNSASLRVPLIVLSPWWKNTAAQILAAAMLAGVAAMLAWQISRRRLARRLAELERHEELNRERARIARDMHDVVGARLTQLAMMQEIFAVEHPQTAGAQEQLQRITGTARETVSALDEAVWAVNPRNDTLQNVADYLCHAASEYLTPLKIACRQDVASEWPAIEVVSQKRHELLLALKEALQNVVKHAKASRVALTLRHDSGEFLVCIEDDGRGLSAQIDGPEKDGVGNMVTRLTSIGGTCTVRPSTSGGTVVEMQIPV